MTPTEETHKRQRSNENANGNEAAAEEPMTNGDEEMSQDAAEANAAENGYHLTTTTHPEQLLHQLHDEFGDLGVPIPACTTGASQHQQEYCLFVKQIVLENFKSYRQRTVIGPFLRSLSCIIGPNGSGKSNVIDALLFVFGYRSRKLRAMQVSDLIYQRDPAGEEAAQAPPWDAAGDAQKRRRRRRADRVLDNVDECRVVVTFVQVHKQVRKGNLAKRFWLKIPFKNLFL